MKWRDGSKYEPPENPLKDKWEKLYPSVPKPEYSQVCDDYSCMWCERCPKGEYWEVPDEDKAVYQHYMTELYTYIEKHGGIENLILTEEFNNVYWEAKDE